MSDYASREKRHPSPKLSQDERSTFSDGIERPGAERRQTDRHDVEREKEGERSSLPIQPETVSKQAGDGDAATNERRDGTSARAKKDVGEADRRTADHPRDRASFDATTQGERPQSLTKRQKRRRRMKMRNAQRSSVPAKGSDFEPGALSGRDGANASTVGSEKIVGKAQEGRPDERPPSQSVVRTDEPGKGKPGGRSRSRRRRFKRRSIVKAAADPDARTPDAHVDADAGTRSGEPRGRAESLRQAESGGAGQGAQPNDANPIALEGRDPPPTRPDRPTVYAALDLGTNNCRLLIAIPTRPGQFRVIDAFSRIVRLGEGLSRTGSLSRGAMDRAISALSVCAQKLSARDVTHCRLIATEACRQAANGEEFIEQVTERTGLSLEIVTRETEARLAVSGCGSLIDRNAKGAVLFDIGGGSSEIALLDLRARGTRNMSSRIVAWTSLPVGVVTLAERHGGRDVTPEIFEAMVADSVALIERFADRGKLGSLVGSSRFHLLGTSGTVTTLAGVHLNLERYDRRQVDGLWLTDEEADGLVEKIAGWSFAERVANPCIGSDRADLVLAGCAIFQAIRRIWPAKSLRVADRGLREGLLTEMMVANGAWRRTERRGAARR